MTRLLGFLLGFFIALLLPTAALADSSTAALTYPANSATNVDTSVPFSWSSVQNVTWYYLYVGTSEGASDVVNSGGLSPGTTSYQVPPLPVGQTLWARLWTDVGGAWSYQDVSFTAGTLLRSYFSYPLSGASAVDPATAFAWYAVPNVQQYVLAVGTSQGASDLLYSGGLSPGTTSYQVPGLPVGPTLWARIWTQVGGGWRYRDVSFVATAPSHATFSYPQNGSTSVDTSKGLQWAGVSSAQAYYVYVGTSQGASDLVNSGSLAPSTTSFALPPLPVGQTLWARIYTEVGGSWNLYQDVSFQVSISAAQFSYPSPGQANFDTRTPMSWQAAPGAQGYYVWVGTAPGKSDLVNSGALSASTTSYSTGPLPVGQTVYARLYTEVNGSWNVYTSTSFTVAYSAATLTYPSPRWTNPNVDASQPFTWGAVSGASGYVLWIGTSPGADDVVHSPLLTSTSYAPGALPVGQPLWARLWTLSSGAWVYQGDVPFSAAGQITAPAQQSIAVDPSQPVSWAPGGTVNGKAPSYELLVGSRPGVGDLFDSGSISTTSMTVPASAMPRDRPVYARVIYTLGDGSQRRTDTVFAVAGGTIAPAQMNWGTSGSSAVDTSLPFTWTASDLAQGYRLQILNGGSTVADSGVIHVPEYFDENLPTGSYTAQLGTELGGSWQWTTASFTVTNSGRSAANEIDAAHWATNYVRHMADASNYVYAWTRLYSDERAFPKVTMTCGGYAIELLNILKEMNISASLAGNQQAYRLDIGFTTLDGHVVVAFYNTDDSDWIVLDPTFDIAMKRASDGHWATAQDAQAATASKNWSAIQYTALGDFGISIAQAYYLDYPLLYLDVPIPTGAGGADPTPYLTPTPMPVNQSQRGLFLPQSSSSTAVTLVVNGQSVSLATTAASGFGQVFGANSVALPPGSTQTVGLYSPNRYVF